MLRRVAVTGASGFLGRYVLQQLRSYQDVQVVAMARSISQDCTAHDGCEYVKWDLSSDASIAYEKLGTPDVVIHLAWDKLPNYQNTYHIETELPQQFRFLNALISAGLNRLLVTGTCFEYGMAEGALDVDHATVPTNPYGQAKDSLHRQLRLAIQKQKTELIWARLFYMYGAGQNQASLYSQLKVAVERGDTVFNMSGGEQIRDFLPVEEVAKQIVDAALSPAVIPVMNICSGQPVTVKSLVQSWLERNNWSIAMNLGYYPYSTVEPMSFWGVSHLQSRVYK
jgi:nucleoside-diphosphate-sugar epimerase